MGDLPLTRGCRGLFSVSPGAVSCWCSRLRVTRSILTVKMSGQQVPPRPHDPTVLWNMVTEVKRPLETHTINPLPLNERIFCNFNISQCILRPGSFLTNKCRTLSQMTFITQHRAVFIIGWLYTPAQGPGRNTKDPLHGPDPSTGKHVHSSVLCLSMSE